MKTKEEILDKHGCPANIYDETLIMSYSGALMAMEEYARQKKRELLIDFRKWYDNLSEEEAVWYEEKYEETFLQSYE